ncbi:ribosome maturation factor RimM [Buchnera aphidicola]|uniref:16S rRNA processing protein RimM n=1 Tax=Buchnera aphidicola (Stegophylla sp.) TaxID=2315800 RepID=A0A4D6YN09_9GAMM|nr:16S rRNA processing protein RimM [Buchnera aphidicola (Stegophylla sp.)]
MKNNHWKTISLEHKKIYQNKIIIKIKNINNRDQAKKLVNSLIMIDAQILPNLKQFEYYWKDIISCRVFNTYQKYIGIVYNIIRSKSNDILVIKNYYHEILIPFIKDTIIYQVDIINKIIHVNWN